VLLDFFCPVCQSAGRADHAKRNVDVILERRNWDMVACIHNVAADDLCRQGSTIYRLGATSTLEVAEWVRPRYMHQVLLLVALSTPPNTIHRPIALLNILDVLMLREGCRALCITRARSGGVGWERLLQKTNETHTEYGWNRRRFVVWW
jgi:hypothetical protein